MKLPLVFKSTETSSAKSSSSSLWPWSNCNNPKTLSFRANNNSEIFKTINNVYINTPDSPYSPISLKTILQKNSNDDEGGAEEDESIEMVIKGLSSERFFIQVSGETNSILEESNNKKVVLNEVYPVHTPPPLEKKVVLEDDRVVLFEESVAMEMESRDPFVDFRRSMEEMMEANDDGSMKQKWDFLEELLGCYLKVNHKSNHGYIVGAFVDLLVGLEFGSATNNNNNNNNNIDYLSPSSYSENEQLLCCCSSSSIGCGDGGGGEHSFTSPLSFYSSASSISPCLSSLMESEDEIEKSVENGHELSSSSLILSRV